MPSEPGRAGEARTSRSRGAATCASSGQTRRARTVDSSAGFALQSRLLHPQMATSTPFHRRPKRKRLAASPEGGRGGVESPPTIRRRTSTMSTRRFKAAAVACGILATAGLTTAVVGAAQPQGPPTGTLQLLQRNREANFRFIDVPPLQGVRRTPTPGDGAVITGPMRDSAGSQAGRLQALFTFTSPKRGQIQVSATFVLRDGRICASGAETNARIDDFAVTGGTGRFTGARGTLRVTDGKRVTSFLFTFVG